jgi:signal transduction histidine kinase
MSDNGSRAGGQIERRSSLPEPSRVPTRFTEAGRPRFFRNPPPLPHHSMLRAGVPEAGGEGSDEAMDAVARLAGKVAHHLNNLLTVVGCSASYLEEELPDQRFSAELQDIRDACHQASALSTQLLSISGRRWSEARVVDLRTVVLDLELGRLFSDDIVFVVDVAAATCPVCVDPGHLGEVVTGLVHNAREAVGPSGTVLVRIDRLPGRTTEGRPATGWVRLEVSDSGPGMDPETLGKAFHPFFSRHPFTADRGLGLTAAYGIVRQSGGTMKLSSAPGYGTTANVWLPAAPPATRTHILPLRTGNGRPASAPPSCSPSAPPSSL